MPAENTREFPCFAVDTSFVAAYVLNGYFDDEAYSCVKDIEYILENNGQLYVTQLFWFEIENVLLQKTRSSRSGLCMLSKSDAMNIIYDLQQLPIYTDLQPNGEIRQRIFDIAAEHNLSYYDASYLELSRRYGIPLKTYDEDLLRAMSSARE